MRTIFKTLLCVLFLSATSVAFGQYDSIYRHLQHINAFYDSSVHTGFDVRFVYESDTVLGNYEHRENQGSFIIDRNRYYYKLDFTECIQTDSVLLTILKPEELILVSPPSPFAAGGILPMRNRIDSLITTELANHTYSLSSSDSNNIIRFFSTDSSSLYNSFALHYDPVTFALNQYEIGFDYFPETDSSEAGELIRPGPSTPRKLTLRVYFFNYHVAMLPQDLFNLDNYIKADGMDEWIGVGKYDGYTVSKFNR